MKRLMLALAASAAAMTVAPAANAAIYIAYSTDGGATKTTLVNNGSGTVGYSGNQNGYSFNVGATGAPDVLSPEFLSNSINVQTGANAAASQLILYFTQTNNTSFNGGLLSQLVSNGLSGSAQNVTITSWYSNANALYTGTQLQSRNFTGQSTFTGGNQVNATGPFSTTFTYTLNFGAGRGTFNSNAQLTAVPEPATWAMMMLGFGAMGAMIRRRKTTTSARIRFA